MQEATIELASRPLGLHDAATVRMQADRAFCSELIANREELTVAVVVIE
jgi:hypothetical protein